MDIYNICKCSYILIFCILIGISKCDYKCIVALLYYLEFIIHNNLNNMV